jgi:hypothetical protein
MDRRRAPAAGGAAVSMRRAGAATPAFQASARALARVIPAVGARRRPAREARPATRASTTRRARAQDAGLALLLQAPLRGRGGHPILRGVRSYDDRDPDGATHVCGGTATVDHLPANPLLSRGCLRADRTFEQRYVFCHCNAQSAILSAPTHRTGRGEFQTCLPWRSDAARNVHRTYFLSALEQRVGG